MTAEEMAQTLEREARELEKRAKEMRIAVATIRARLGERPSPPPRVPAAVQKRRDGIVTLLKSAKIPMGPTAVARWMLDTKESDPDKLEKLRQLISRDMAILGEQGILTRTARGWKVTDPSRR